MSTKDSTAQRIAQAAELYSAFERASRSLFKKYDAAIREMKTRFETLDAD